MSTVVTPPIVIGLTGKARAGKDTVARIVMELVAEYNDSPGMEHQDSYMGGAEAFAAPIKSMVAMLLDFFGCGSVQDHSSMRPYIDGDKKEDIIPAIGASPRTLMQTLGTEWGRQIINDDIWLESMSTRLDMYKQAVDHGYRGAIVVITDVRFDNEADRLISSHGAHILQVVRDDVPDSVGEEGHQSELGLNPEYLYKTIRNNGTPEHLVEEVRKQLKDILPTAPILAVLEDDEEDSTDAEFEEV